LTPIAKTGIKPNYFVVWEIFSDNIIRNQGIIIAALPATGGEVGLFSQRIQDVDTVNQNCFQYLVKPGLL
jgi:hypothetical protein